MRLAILRRTNCFRIEDGLLERRCVHSDASGLDCIWGEARIDDLIARPVHNGAEYLKNREDDALGPQIYTLPFAKKC